nr:hypothetical protein [Tanacetum cinerariifolium]
MHTIKDDSVLGRLEFVAKNEDCQKAKKGSKATSQPKKASSVIASDDSDPEPPKKTNGKRKPIGVVIKDTPVVSKKKTPVQIQNHKGIEMLLKAALLEEAQTRKPLKISIWETSLQHQTSGLSKGAGSKPEVLDEPKGKPVDTSEGAGSKPEVSDVSKVMSSDQESKNESGGDSEDGDGDHQSDDERTKLDDGKSIDLNRTNDEE